MHIRISQPWSYFTLDGDCIYLNFSSAFNIDFKWTIIYNNSQIKAAMWVDGDGMN